MGLSIRIAAAGLLGACGSNQPRRTEGGMAAGAATGGAIGFIARPAGILIGAALGGGAEALSLVNTGPDNPNLGGPP